MSFLRRDPAAPRELPALDLQSPRDVLTATFALG